MSISEVDPTKQTEALVEAQLQQELQTLFIIDTQNALQRYSQIIEQLRPQSWAEDIRELYRCVHTVKGGAVTVAADAALQVATVVEDLLSDLRYLDVAPPLADGQLHQTLLEVGELLTGTLDFSEASETIRPQLEPILRRIQVLHHQVQNHYLPMWNEQKQLHQEFAEQGFDLVVLDLEIALEQATSQGIVFDMVLPIAQQTLIQLEQIGEHLQLAPGWNHLLLQAQTLFEQPELSFWQSQWSRLFHALKICAKQSGKPVAFEIEGQDDHNGNEWAAKGRSPVEITETTFELDEDALFFLDEPVLSTNQFLDNPNQANDFSEIDAFLEDPHSLDESLLDSNSPLDFLNRTEPPKLKSSEDFLDIPGSIESIESTLDLDTNELAANLADELAADLADELDFSIEIVDFAESRTGLDDMGAPTVVEQVGETKEQRAMAVSPPTPQFTPTRIKPAQPDRSTLNLDKVQIPVPLEKLDQSSQYLIETLLAARITKGFYQTLQSQINQLVILAQEGAQYITHLRQIQDDYALLDHLQSSTQGPTPERYRQGYTTINRLLETSLRLSELGKETERTALQTAENLQNLDTSLLKLQNTVEDSRLVSFQNLGFRAKAILRDLVTRYSKPAHLVMQGEPIELDVSTARSLEPALLHLIRNAYAHGLEPAEQRLAQGKPEQGTIVLSLQRRGNTFQLKLKDDGRGIDARAIQSRAEALELPLTQTQTPADLLAVICQPGFSSEAQVSEISGRGVGMDIVAAQIARLGGKLSLDTTLGTGTTFQLQFPVPHLLVPCLMLQAGDRTFAVPTEDIRTTALFDTLQTTRLDDKSSIYSYTVQQESGTSPALDLLSYWRVQSLARSFPDTAVCVYIQPQDATQGIWLIADELLEQAELLISPLPAPLIAPQGLMGVSLQNKGTLMPVLDATTLTDWLLTASTQEIDATQLQPSEPDFQTVEESQPVILIVDDAALIRRRIGTSLKSYGYLTQTCTDGLEAWNWLQKNPCPTLIITDIEMPNMDGFTLTDRCRQAGITAPVLVISSRLSEEWLTEARRLGATDYLTKGFSTVELINKVKFLLGSAAVS